MYIYIYIYITVARKRRKGGQEKSKGAMTTRSEYQSDTMVDKRLKEVFE